MQVSPRVVRLIHVDSYARDADMRALSMLVAFNIAIDAGTTSLIRTSAAIERQTS